jgi:hypothetical protein
VRRISAATAATATATLHEPLQRASDTTAHCRCSPPRSCRGFLMLAEPLTAAGLLELLETRSRS